MRFYVWFIIIILTFIACNDDEPEILETQALLSWTGDYPVDGCGFFIFIDGKEYKAMNEYSIDDRFKVTDPMRIKLKYKPLDQYVEVWCGIGPSYFDSIEIISIDSINK